MFVIGLGPLENLRGTNCELRTARHADSLRDADTWKEVSECVGVEYLCAFRVGAQGIHFAGTTYDPNTAQVDIAAGLYVRHAKVLEDGYTVVHWIVIVPLVAETVHEDHYVRQIRIVVNDESEAQGQLRHAR